MANIRRILQENLGGVRLIRYAARFVAYLDRPSVWFFPKLTFLALVFAAMTPAQAASPVPDSNAIMGFETPAGWILSGDYAATRALATTTRTQGNFALELLDPATLTTLTSLPVASTANALAGIGNAGAVLEVDVTLPTQGNRPTRGALQLFVSSLSRHLSNEPVGSVDFFGGLRLGTYTTLEFPVPDNVRNALGGAAFNDLTFQFVLSSPSTNGTGPYMFDNLRVHSVPLVTAAVGVKPPPGYGGSVNFVVIGGAPVAQLFNTAIVQVPDAFHLKLGKAGATTVQLALGYDGAPAFTCNYSPDSSDPAGTSYVFTSSTGPNQPGDLVGANWAQLTILGGDPGMKLRAQLAQNPVGDMAGSGIIPPMPTYWGDFNDCDPAPVAGVVRTTSPGCASQVAQANQIVTAYFNKVNNSNTAPNWVVTPKPEFALRFGNGAPNNNLVGPPPPPGDPPIPFDQEGHMNPGGSFDAYWRLNGMFNAGTQNTTSTSQSTAHLDATLGGHVVLFGNDVDVASADAVIDASSGQGMFNTCDSSAPMKPSPDAFACFDVYLFGNHIFSQNFHGSVSIPNGPLFSQSTELDLPPIPIWIFSITLGATASIEVDLNNAQFAVTGFDLELAPSAKLGAHLFGGINLGIASGGLDAKIELIEVSAPISAQAEWELNTLPTACSATLTLQFSGFVNISSGGGEVDLVASFGPCPFCVDQSWTLFSWGPLISPPPYPLFNVSTNVTTFPLVVPLCKIPPVITISNPVANSTLSTGTSYQLIGSATIPGVGAVDCKYLTFSLTPLFPAESFNSSACGAGAMTLTTPGARMLTLSVNELFNSAAGPILEQGSQPESLNVEPLPPGPHITQISLPSIPGSTITGQPPFDIQSTPPNPPVNNPVMISVPLGAIPGQIQLVGAIVGTGGTDSWSVTDSSGNTTPIGSGLAVAWTVTHDILLPAKVTLSDSKAGSATMLVTVIERVQ